MSTSGEQSGEQKENKQRWWWWWGQRDIHLEDINSYRLQMDDGGTLRERPQLHPQHGNKYLHLRKNHEIKREVMLHVNRFGGIMGCSLFTPFSGKIRTKTFEGRA